MIRGQYMERFCIITNREKDGSMEVTNRIAAFLENRGGKIYLAGEEYRGGGARYTRAEDIPEDTQCALCLLYTSPSPRDI